jgi:hypothetical protein
MKESSMNKDQIFGIIRTVAAAGFGFLAGKGYLEASMVEALSGAIATIAVAVWSVAAKKPAA